MAGARYHADDLGMTAAVNGATAALLAAGRLVGVSLVANGLATTEAVDLVRGQIDPADVEHELEAQLDRLDHLGVTVAGIDSHHHVHAFAPVGDIVERVAARRGLTGGRSYRLMRTHTPGGHGKKLLLSLLARASSWTSAGHGGLPASWRTTLGDDFAVASWERLDRAAGPGRPAAATIVCHPGATCDRALPHPAPDPPLGTTRSALPGHVAAAATDAHRP